MWATSGSHYFAGLKGERGRPGTQREWQERVHSQCQPAAENGGRRGINTLTAPSSYPLVSAGAAQEPSPTRSHRTRLPRWNVHRDRFYWAHNGRGKNGEDIQPSPTFWILGNGSTITQTGVTLFLSSSPRRFNSLMQGQDSRDFSCLIPPHLHPLRCPSELTPVRTDRSHSPLAFLSITPTWS